MKDKKNTILKALKQKMGEETKPFNLRDGFLWKKEPDGKWKSYESLNKES